MDAHFHFDRDADLKQPDNKRALNLRLFNIVAPRYNALTRMLSFGKDSVWKKALINKAPIETPKLCLDLACGTGDLSSLLAKRYPKAAVIGIDLNLDMLVRAKNRGGGAYCFIRSDMEHLPFPDNSMDMITGGYALRNAPDLPHLLQVIYCKLKPGGWAGFLDFTRVNSKSIFKFHYFILTIWSGLWGLIFHANPSVYTYIPETLKLFPDMTHLKRMIVSAGFSEYDIQSYFMGMVSMISFKKR